MIVHRANLLFTEAGVASIQGSGMGIDTEEAFCLTWNQDPPLGLNTEQAAALAAALETWVASKKNR